MADGQHQKNAAEDRVTSALGLVDDAVLADHDALSSRVGEVLAEVFSKPGAAERREAVIAAAGGIAAVNHDAQLVELDRLIDAFVLRLHGPQGLSIAAPEAVAPVPRDESPRPEVEETVIVAEQSETTPPPLPPQVPQMPELPANVGLSRGARVFDDQPDDAPPLPREITKSPAVAKPPPVPTVEPERRGPLIPPMVGDLRSVGLLYEDIIWLVSIDDWPGALISLERLLVMAELAGHVKEFVDVNEVKLLSVYETFIGPFNRVPTMVPRNIDNAMPSAYRRSQKIAELVEMIDGERTLKMLLRNSPVSPLETCSIISQLRRSAQLELSAP